MNTYALRGQAAYDRSREEPADPDAAEEQAAREAIQRERDEDRAFWNHHGDTQ